MTKRTAPPSPTAGRVVEIDAMDVAEWENGQSTPQASDANLAELVRRAKSPESASSGGMHRGGRAQTEKLVSVRSRIAGQVAVQPAGRARTTPPKPAPKPARERRAADGSQVVSPMAADDALAATAAVTPAPVLATRAPASPGGAAPVASPFETTTSVSGLPAGIASAARAQRDPRPPPVAIDVPAASAASVASAPTMVASPPIASAEGSGVPFAPWRGDHSPQPPPDIAAEASPARQPQPAPVDAPPPASQLLPSDVIPGPDIGLHDGTDGNTDRRLVAMSRRRLWLVGGALGGASLVVIIAAVVLASSGETSEPAPVEAPRQAAVAPASDVATAPAATTHATTRPRAAASTTTDAADRSGKRPKPPVSEAPATRPTSSGRSVALATAPAPGPAHSRARSHPAKKPASKKLVVDYSSRPSDPPPPGLLAQSEEDPAVGQARTAYTIGNQKLFTGDLDGAITAYRQALELYPGYVGGYRGLGLAYAQRGDKAQALTALKAYVAAVPTARDVGIIKKRIAHLQGK